MDRDKLRVCNGETVAQVKRKLARWYRRDGDYILVPHGDRAAASAKLFGQLQLDTDATTPRTPGRQAGTDAGRILAVAHLDTVLREHWTKDTGEVIYSPALDDRIGLYTFFVEFGAVECDILLTDHEEVGRSTAQFFEHEREYNWMVQFDRRGVDVVMYQYDTDANRNRLVSVGATPGLGSFSDIAYLDHLGVAGFNWGTGYWGEHTHHCHLVVADYEAMLGQFLEFYAKYGAMRIEHTGEAEEEAWRDYAYWREVECDLCGRPCVEEALRWSAELQCWACDDCEAEMGGIGADWGNCLGCGQWRELKAVAAVGGDRLCASCRKWWGEN